jgi:ribosome biogenesis protein NSA2
VVWNPTTEFEAEAGVPLGLPRCSHCTPHTVVDLSTTSARTTNHSIKAHEEKLNKQKIAKAAPEGAIPAYLMDREGQSRAKTMSNMIKQKRKEKAGKWSVPLPKVKAVDEAEVMKVVRTGKSKRKAWKRMITKHTFVPEGFTRKPPKFERFIRPTG